MNEPRPFLIDVPESDVVDLRERLRRSRILPDSPRRPRSGMTSAYLAELVDSWSEWDWRARERHLNGYPQFVAAIGGGDIHFVHRRGAEGAPVLLVMHGWPHTFALQLELLDRLPDWTIVVPSFPGFAFSPASDEPLTEALLARTMLALMTETLGYRRFFTYGEDVSANVSDLIAATAPDAVEGIIATHAHFGTNEERALVDDPLATAFFGRLAGDHEMHGAYGHVQATRPDTLAAALNESPVGLLAWITEKLVEWSDSADDDPRDVERSISRDRILTEASIYWFTQSIGTSFRPYHEGADEPGSIPPVEVPAAVHVQRHEHDYPESVARGFYRDLREFERLDAGGHFTVAEIPGAMAERFERFALSVRGDRDAPGGANPMRPFRG